MQKLAVFGGTFNPIHWGHLLIAETALSQMQLDQVLWVPALQPPHKFRSDLLLSYEQRSHLVELAIASHPQFKLVDLSVNSAAPSFAIDTLKALQKCYPDALWHWIVGLDTFQTLPRWYARRDLAPYCCWLVAPRPPTSLLVNDPNSVNAVETPDLKLDLKQICVAVAEQLAAQSIPIRWQILQMPLVGISSSLVRAYCQQGRSIRYLVPDAVAAYISVHRLYQA
jgi:nicotinate-nucleotide adenylyltransferase